MTEHTEPMNAGPGPIQLPSQDPALAPAAEGADSSTPKGSRRTLQAALAGAAAVALLAVAGITGFAIGSASHHDGRGDGPGGVGVEANGAPSRPDGIGGGPEGMRDGDRDGGPGMPDGDGRGHRHRDGHGMDMPGQEMPGQDFIAPDGGPSSLPPLPSAPSTPNS